MRLAAPLLAFVGLVALTVPASAVDQIQAFSTASLSQEPGHEGEWKYCVQVSWLFDAHDLGHLDLFLDLATFQDGCNGSSVTFPSPAGTSIGVDLFTNDCSVDYRGEFLCKTDPSLKLGDFGATVKFEPIELGCFTEQVGHGSFCFYSSVAPGLATAHGNAIAIKHGTEVDFGGVLGSLPQLPGEVPPGAPVVINEFLVRPPAGVEEFIELKNKTNDPVDLEGWRISIGWRDPVFNQLYLSDHTFIAGDVLPAGGYLVEVPDFSDWSQYCASCIGIASPPPLSSQSARGGAAVQAPGDDFIFDPGGIIILYDDNSVIVDQVAYGNAGGAPISCPLVGGGTLPPGFSPGRPGGLQTTVDTEYATTTNRTPDGQDTNNDAVDFQIGAPTPDATNVSATPDLGSSVRLNTVYVYPKNGDGVAPDEAVEFYNPLSTPVDIGSWYISDGFQIRPIFPAGAQVLVDTRGKFTLVNGANGTVSSELEADDRIDLYDNRAAGLTRVDQLGWIRVPEFFPNMCFARSPDGAGPSSGWDWETSGGFVTLFYEEGCGLEAPNTATETLASDIATLAAPRPNPANDGTTVAFVVGGDAGAGAFARVGIYDVAGRQIGTAGDGFYPPGRYVASWDGRTSDGGRVAPGVYFMRLIVNGRAAGAERTVVWLRD